MAPTGQSNFGPPPPPSSQAYQGYNQMNPNQSQQPTPIPTTGYPSTYPPSSSDLYAGQGYAPYQQQQGVPPQQPTGQYPPSASPYTSQQCPSPGVPQTSNPYARGTQPVFPRPTVPYQPGYQ